MLEDLNDVEQTDIRVIYISAACPSTSHIWCRLGGEWPKLLS